MVEVYTLVTFVALLTAIAFVSLYSRYRWEDTAEGVNAMALGVFIALLASARLLQVLFGLDAFASYISVVAWVCLTSLLAHRIMIIIDLHRPKLGGDNKKEARK